MVEQPDKTPVVARNPERSLAWEFRHLVPMVAVAVVAVVIWDLIVRWGI